MLVKAKKDLQWLHFFSAVLLRLVLCKYELTVEGREITQKTEDEKNIYQVWSTRYLNSFGCLQSGCSKRLRKVVLNTQIAARLKLAFQ